MAAAIGWLAYRLFARSVSRATHEAEVARLTAGMEAGIAAREKLRQEKDAALEACERRGDELEEEIRGMYERMLDAAYSAKRQGPPRPHRGTKETLEARRKRLQTVTCELTDSEREEFTQRLAAELAGGEPPPPTAEV